MVISIVTIYVRRLYMRLSVIVAIAAVFLFSAAASAGVPQMPLVEQFTNARCPACNSIEDTMKVIFEEYTGDITPVLYHTWWPGYDDPFWQFDSTEIKNYTYTYAGIPPWISYLYVPSFRFNGEYMKDPSDDDFVTLDDWYAWFRGTCDSLMLLESPIRIRLTENVFNEDTTLVNVGFDVVVVDSVDTGTPIRIFLAVTEWQHRVFGYGKHDHVFRSFEPGYLGDSHLVMLGDSLHFDWSYPVDPEYWTDRLVTNIFIKQGMEVLQSARQELDEISGIDVVDTSTPVVLGKNTPNPFKTQTSISYSLARGGEVELAVYSLTGRLVAHLVDGYASEGAHRAVWDGRDRFGRKVGPGVYYYRLVTDQGMRAGKMILLR
jgi:hypothetical protein